MKKPRRWRFLGATLAGLILLVILAGLRILDPPPMVFARSLLFDSYQRLAPRPYQAAPVRVIDIDDESLAVHGQWPWSRALLAKLLDRLGQMGAAVVVFDMVFAEPDRQSPAQLLTSWAEFPELLELLQNARSAALVPDFDQLFADVIGRYRTVGGFALTHKINTTVAPSKASFAIIGPDPRPVLPDSNGAIVNIPVLQEAFSGYGNFMVTPAGGLLVRHLPLLGKQQDQLLPSLALEALRLAQGSDTIGIRTASQNEQLLGVERIKVGAFDFPVNPDSSLWLHFTRPVPERMISARNILTDDLVAVNKLAPLIAGNIVLIGTSSAGLGDLVATPIAPAMAGVLLDAQGIEQIILGWFLQRPFWADGVETAFIVVLGLILILLLPRLGALWCALITSLSILAAFASSWLVYLNYRLLLDPAFPVLACLTIYSLISLFVYIRSDKEKSQIRRAFTQYLAPQLLHQLEQEPERLNIGGETREMSFLFSDIAGFTSLSEAIPPQQLVQLLNAYLDGACKVIMEQGGTVNKIIGDAIYVIFSAPLEQADHARRAVRCALALDQFAREFSKQRQAQGIPFGKTRIGVNTGTAVVGNFGGESRFDYTAHGDAVNTAARLENANKVLGTNICIAGATVRQCPELLFRPVGDLLLRGKSVSVTVYEPLVEMTDHYRRYLTAYESLQAGDGAAVAGVLQNLAQVYPDDPIYALYVQRLRDGFMDSKIQIT